MVDLPRLTPERLKVRRWSLARRFASRVAMTLRALQRSRKRTRLSAARAMIRVGARLGTPGLAALGLFIATEPRTHHAGWRNPKEGAKRIVSLHNAGLISDLDVALADRTDVQLFTIGGGYLRLIGRRFLQSPLLDFSQAQHRAEFPRQHERHQQFLAHSLKRYMARLGTQTFVAGNFTYWNVFDLGKALDSIGSELIIVHKEGLVSAWDSVADEYGDLISAGVGKTSAHRVAVQSSATRALLTASGVTGSERVWVTGTARLDACHAHRRAAALAPASSVTRSVTFFTFWPYVGISLLDKPRPGALSPDLAEGWAETLEQTIEAAVEFAELNPTIRVVIKSKPAPSRGPKLGPLLARAESAGLSNLSVISKGEGQSLVLESLAVVALNSTIILEAIASGTAAFIPRLATAGLRSADRNLLDLEGCAIEVHSRDELFAALRSACESEPSRRSAELSPAAARVLTRYAGNADGLGSERLREFLMNESAEQT